LSLTQLACWSEAEIPLYFAGPRHSRGDGGRLGKGGVLLQFMASFDGERFFELSA